MQPVKSYTHITYSGVKGMCKVASTTSYTDNLEWRKDWCNVACNRGNSVCFAVDLMVISKKTIILL